MVVAERILLISFVNNILLLVVRVFCVILDLYFNAIFWANIVTIDKRNIRYFVFDFVIT